MYLHNVYYKERATIHICLYIYKFIAKLSLLTGIVDQSLVLIVDSAFQIQTLLRSIRLFALFDGNSQTFTLYRELIRLTTSPGWRRRNHGMA